MSDVLTIGYWFPLRCSVLDCLGIVPQKQRIIGISADHGGYDLKQHLIRMLQGIGYNVRDFGNLQLNDDDDYPDFIVPMARAVGFQEVSLGVAICGSGVGAAIVANKIPGGRG